MDPALIGFGLGVGALVGMTGIGGGSLMTPLLILAFGVTPVTAVGTDLSYAAVTKTVGGWKHWRQGTVDAPLSIWMAFGSVPAALTGVYVLERLERAYGPGFDDLLLTLLGLRCCCAARVRWPAPCSSASTSVSETCFASRRGIRQRRSCSARSSGSCWASRRPAAER